MIPHIDNALKKFSPYLPLVLVIATCAVYAVTGSFEFLGTWDDKLYIQENVAIRGFTLSNLKEAFSSIYVGNYAPIHIISYMLDYTLWGLNPTGYHLLNVLLHAANGALLYLVLRREGLPELQGAAAAWIFLFHPVQVETVAWASQRKNLLAMLFFLAALACYQTYCRRRTARLFPYILTSISLLVALLSKSVAVIFPAVVLVYDYTAAQLPPSSALKRLFDKLPFVLLVVAAIVMTIISQSGEYLGGLRHEYLGGSPAATFYTMVSVLVSYLQDCLWPFNLSPDYLVKIRQQPDSGFFIAGAVLTPFAGLGFWIFRKMRPVLFWYLLFFIALLPVMQIVPLVTQKNDRYLYFPLLGFAVVTVVLAGHSCLNLPSPFKRGLKSLFVGILLLLPILSFKQTLLWKDDITLWTRAVTVNPDNFDAWRSLSRAYTLKGDTQGAMKAFNLFLEKRRQFGPINSDKDLF